MSDLFTQATEVSALLRATRRASLGKRGRPDVARFLMDAERECLRLRDALRRPIGHPDAWKPGIPRHFSIRDPKPRMITAVPFIDRVVHHALCAEMEPLWERYAIFDSYACREGKGQHAAVERASHFARGALWAFKGDVTAFFASVPHEPLLRLLRRLVPDERLCELMGRIVRAHGAGRGLPIGALTSQHLANLYLGQLDHFIKDQRGVRRYLRYMDDLVAFGERDAMRELWAAVKDLQRPLGLVLNETRSLVLPVRDGVPVLGLRVFGHKTRLQPERRRRFDRRQAEVEAALREGEITEEEAASRLTSQLAHIARLCGGLGRGRQRPEPCETRRLVEQRCRQRPGREPQQQRPRQPRQQPRVSRGEFNKEGLFPLQAPEGASLRIGPLCVGVDQSPVLRLQGLLGTESPWPGGDLRVAAGPSSFEEES